jgi:hypothetical protein
VASCVHPGGINTNYGNNILKVSSRAARDEALQKRLWEVSEEVTNLEVPS